jgi:eukaryotic-like serine/threonine-protein kinase
MDLELPSKAAPVALSVGDSVGPWRIEGELGFGGMSTVYAVVHTEIEKRAALKVVHAHVLSPAFPAERVLLEAQVVNRIAHGNIVDIFENGTLPDGRPYLVMERLAGVSLEEQLGMGRLTTEEVIAILLPICSALTAAHAAGIVHCDLKPENVFLVGGGQVAARHVKVLDWGISRVVTPQSEERSEMTIGTPRYISPEQVQGREPAPPSDIYSLGVMAYELFLEAQLFSGESTPEILRCHLQEAPPNPEEIWPGIPPALSRLLLTMLAKAPTTRPTAADVAAELTAVRDELRARYAPRAISESSELYGSGPVPRAITEGGERPSGALPLYARRAEPELTEITDPSRARRKRSMRRPFSGGEWFAAAGVLTVIAGVGAMLGYRTARGGVAEAQATTLGAMPAVVASATGSMHEAAAARAETPDPVRPASAELARQLEGAPPTPAAKPARPAHCAGAPSAAGCAGTAGAVATKPARLAPSTTATARKAGELRGAAKPAAPSALRRAPARAVDPNGTIDPY